MLKIMESEFISDSDKSMLENQLTRFADVKDSDVKSKLTDLIELEQENIETVQQAIVKNEATVAKKEINVLQTELEKLTSKSEEPFILKEDALLIDKLQQEIKMLDTSVKVKPVREIAQEVDDLSIQLIDNQKQAKSSVEELKEFNKKL
jgi:DNA polymerase III delta prime subunit